MKSSLRSDEIQGKPWMKSNPSKYNPAKQDFIAKAISSAAGGFHPSKTDLTACSPLRITRQGGRCFFYFKSYKIAYFVAFKLFCVIIYEKL